MSSDSRRIVARAFAGVLEKLSFQFAEPVESAAELTFGDVPYCVADMTFGGVMRGSLCLAVSRAATIEIAANMLGADSGDDKPRAQAEDALRELLNVTCGQILTDFAGERPMFTLSVPKTSAIDAQTLTELRSDPATIGFRTDGAPMLLRLRLEETT
jgi:hypothetical protein